MAVMYVKYGSVRVSRRWRVVLQAADRAHVKFHCNSGHRTMRQQTALFRQNMQLVRGRWVKRPGHPLTAFPTPNAPHIFTGRAAHALDVDSLDGGETRLQRWLEQKGATVTNPVRGENWHMVISGADLTRLSNRLKPKPRPATKTSKLGAEFIAGFEGFVTKAMRPVPGDPLTVGFGHTGPDVHASTVVTRAQAMKLLKQDLRQAEAAVRRLVTVPLTQNQFDALVSFVFNVGAGNLESSTLLKRVNKRQWIRAGHEFKKWNRAGVPLKVFPGLTRRRQAEAALFRRKP